MIALSLNRGSRFNSHSKRSLLILETDPISALVSNKICNYHTYHPYSTKYAGTYGYQTEAGKFTAKLRNLISTNNHWSLFAPTQDKAVIGSHSGEFQLAERLKDKHVPLMIACTHGTQSGYFDSFPPARLHPQDSNYARETDENLMPIAPNNINQSLTEVANARHPLDPLGGIILYACTVLSNPNINSAGIKRSENGFAAGFEKLLFCRVAKQGQQESITLNNFASTTEGLDSHLNLLVTELLDGATIQDALIEANREYQPLEGVPGTAQSLTYGGQTYYAGAISGLVPMDMKFKGDSKARLRGLYKNQNMTKMQGHSFEWLYVY